METAALVVRNPQMAANISTAALYRLVDAAQPTLLIDEFDQSARVTEDFRRILNSGFQSNGSVIRSVSGSAVRFRTYCPKMFAGIGKVPDTIRDRSIEIRARRALPNEQDRIERLKPVRTLMEYAPLRDMLQATANRFGPEVGDAEPVPTASDNARWADIWEPLWAVADLAGEPWASRSRVLADAMMQPDPRDEKIGLLADIRTVFGNRARISTAELLAGLNEMHGVYQGPAVRNGKQLADILRPFEVHPRKMRLGTDDSVRGYDRADFRDAWARYHAS
jgi:hypothetical protein